MNLGARHPVPAVVSGFWLPGGPGATRWWLRGVALAILLLAVLLGLRFAADPVRFPVVQVDVLGTLDYTDRSRVKQRTKRHLDRSFYALDIAAIQRSLETMAWIKNAHVRRVWPDRLLLHIDEHEPVARWNERALIAKTLDVFAPPQLEAIHPRYAEWREHFASLPRLEGAAGRHAALMTTWWRYAAEIKPLEISLLRLSEDARRSQTLKLSGSITVRLGYENQMERLRRFVDTYAHLRHELDTQPVRFDMRYTNGFALSGSSTRPGALAGES